MDVAHVVVEGGVVIYLSFSFLVLLAITAPPVTPVLLPMINAVIHWIMDGSHWSMCNGCSWI